MAMLVALVIAAALATGQPPPQSSDPNHVPTPDEIDALQQLYDSSCGSRGYGEYDDVCILITKQLNDAKAAAEKAKAAKPKASPPAPTGIQPPASPPKPTAASGPTA
jgi:hypothetical protein